MHPDADFLANEAFIRRAAAVAAPFMLKGSFVTRQYFADPGLRYPADLDWTYIGGRLSSGEQARQVFDAWATQVTELLMADGVSFTSFRANAFWRMIDYAMDDDFPTINTDLKYHLGDAAPRSLSIDISFNLPGDLSSVPLFYEPAQGEPFIVPHSTPLHLQVAWKLHQTLVRPRFKDLFDLLHLVRHADFNAACRQQALDSFIDECRASSTSPKRLPQLLAGNLAPLFKQAQDLSVDWHWQHWRRPDTPENRREALYYPASWDITDSAKLPTTLAEFEEQLRGAFAQAGFEAGARLGSS